MNVASFTIDHDRMVRGIYVSRKDTIGSETVTTFDIRMKKPNIEPPLDNPVIHTLEHLMAVYLRSDESGWADKIIYIGPMGCRTGMYLIVKGDVNSRTILTLMQNTYQYMIDFEGAIPAAQSSQCGNYLDHNLLLAKWESEKYLNEVLKKMKDENFVYPE